MNRRKKLLLASSATLALALVASLIWRSEPRYGGRSLTDWAIQAQDYEKLALTDKPDYLAASNAIHQMGPAAAKTAIDWLESDARWERSPLRPWFNKLRFPPKEIPQLDRSLAASMVIRLAGKDARSRVEPRLIAMLMNDDYSRADFPQLVLTNFGADTWLKIEPLLLHTNLVAFNNAIFVGIHWPPALKMDVARIWSIRSMATNEFIIRSLDRLLLVQGADTNRLAAAVGEYFLRNSGGPTDGQVALLDAWMLSLLKSAGLPYLKAGLTNQNRFVRSAAAGVLDTDRP